MTVNGKLNRGESDLFDALALFACAIALTRGLTATTDLDWPGEADLFRDMAQAKAFADGRYMDDPAYLGETRWYNPLVPAIAAAASVIFRQPLNEVAARLGTWINLLGPVGFYFLVRRVGGTGAALLALVSFLFLREDVPYWASATYSPWLLPGVFTQGLFYAALLLLLAIKKQRLLGVLGLAVACGVLLVGHTAPALLFGLIFVLAGSGERRAEGRSATARVGGSIGRLGAFVGMAALVSAPLWYPIAVRYRFRIRNSSPGMWEWPETGGLAALLDAAWPGNWAVLLGAIAGLVVVLHRRREPGMRLLLYWGVAAIPPLLYTGHWRALSQAWPGLPPLVPAFHFVFYLKALESVLFGIGVAAGWRLVVRRWGRPEAMERRGVAATALLLTLVAWPAYREREDFTEGRRQAIEASSRADWIAAVRWIESNTEPDAVFVVGDYLALYVVGPAGRKVVEANCFLSSPYVNWMERHKDLKSLFDSLREKDEGRFRELAGKYQARYVLFGTQDIRDLPAEYSFLEFLVDEDGLRIYRLLAPGQPPPSPREVPPLL